MKTFQGHFDDGFKSKPEDKNPSLYSSNAWEAWELGRYFQLVGLPSTQILPSRWSIKTADGRVYKFNYKEKIVKRIK